MNTGTPDASSALRAGWVIETNVPLRLRRLRLSSARPVHSLDTTLPPMMTMRSSFLKGHWVPFDRRLHGEQRADSDQSDFARMLARFAEMKLRPVTEFFSGARFA